MDVLERRLPPAGHHDGHGPDVRNYGRYENATAWALTQKLDKTPLSNTAAITAINNQLQTILMQDLPRSRSGTTASGRR